MSIKFLKYYAIIFLAFHSCEQLDSKNERNILSEENLKLKDSIDKILLLKEKSFLIDSVEMDFSEGLLGTLTYADTLVLSARFSDCGEFGGHKEYLKIYSEKEIYMCLFINKMVDCDQSYTDFIRIDSSLVELSEKNQKRVLEYLLELTEVSMLHQDLSNNFSNDYEMYISSGLSGEPYFLESQLMNWYFQDQSLKWQEFIKLRNEIKTNSNNTYSK